MLNECLRKLAPFLADGRFIMAVVLFLLVWTVTSGAQLYRAAAHLRRRFGLMITGFGEAADPVAFASIYERTSLRWSKDAVLGESWTGFSQTLVIPAEPRRPLIATSDPHEWFELSGLFRCVGADLRYHAALPGLLVGAGLLMTFLGLAAALSAAGDLVASGADQIARNAALHNLLGAASVKFITSLFGLAFSIAYALFRKRQLRLTERRFSDLLVAIHRAMPLRTPASLQVEANDLLERQYAEVQRIGSDFFINLGSTLEREFGHGLEQHIAPLAAAIDKLSASLASQSEDAMQTMLQAFMERLEGAVGGSMRSTTETLEALGGRLDGLQAGMDMAAQRMGRAAEEMATGMGRGTEAALAGVTAQIGELVTRMAVASEQAGRQSRDAGDDMVRRMSETASSLTDAVTSFRSRMEEGAAQGVERLVGPIEALLRHLRDLADLQRATGQQATDELAATIGRSAASLEATTTKIADTLGGGASDATSRIVAASEAMREDLREMLSRAGARLEDSGRTMAASAAIGGKVLDESAASLSEAVALLGERLRRSGEEAGNALREGGASARSSLDDTGRALVSCSAALSERLSDIGNATSDLARQTTAFEAATRSATLPLAAASADLRAAGENARNAVRPLEEVARTIEASAIGLASAGSALTEGLRGGSELAARLATTSDRFEGLDRGIATTIDALVDGLGSYQREIAKFVGDIDSGMSNNVRGLERLVKSLDDSIQDLVDERPTARVGGR